MRNRIALPAIALTAALGLAACSGGSDDTTAGPAADSDAAQQSLQTYFEAFGTDSPATMGPGFSWKAAVVLAWKTPPSAETGPDSGLMQLIQPGISSRSNEGEAQMSRKRSSGRGRF